MWHLLARPSRRWLRPISCGLLLTGAVCLVACGQGAQVERPARQAAQGAPPSAGTLARIGAALSLSGPASTAGAAQRNGLKLAEEEINASHLLGTTRLEVLVEDVPDRSRAGEVFEKFINTNHLVAIVGPTLSDDALAVDPLAQQAAVPVIAISNSASSLTEIGPFIFRDALAESHVSPATVKAVKAHLQVRKAALLYAETDANRSGSHGFKKALQENGVQIVSEQTFMSGDTDFTSQLVEIASADPDALFVSAAAREAAPILIQARQVGLTNVPIVGSGAFGSLAVIRKAGDAAEGLIVGVNWSAANASPRNQQFIQSYQQHFATEPDQFAAQAYTGVYLVAEAVKYAGGPGDLRAVRDGLARIQGLDTPLGRFSFTEAREPSYPVAIEVVRGGQLQPFGT